jgi:hypothetical protein
MCLKYCENYQNVTHTRSGHMLLKKNGADRLARRRVVTDLQFVKDAISAKRNKTRHACAVVLDSLGSVRNYNKAARM